MGTSVQGGTVEAAFPVREDAQAGDLFGKISGVRLIIAASNADEDDEAGVYGGDRLAGDGDGCAGDSLEEGAHG